MTLKFIYFQCHQLYHSIYSDQIIMFIVLLPWIILLLPAAVYLYHYIISQTKFRRLINKIPGPPEYPLFGTILDVIQVDRQSIYQSFMFKLFKCTVKM